MAVIDSLPIFPYERNEFRGTIGSVDWSNGNFTVAYFHGEDGHRFPIVGGFTVEENQPVHIRGRWTQHSRFGDQFTVDVLESERKLQLASDDLIRYLTINPEFAGIGLKRAQQMVKTFGDDFEPTLLETPEQIALTCKIPTDTVRQLQTKWTKRRNVNRQAAQLSAFGLNYHQCLEAIRELGPNPVGTVKADPYQLVGKVRGCGFKRVDEIAAGFGITKEHPGRLKAGLNYLITQELNRGHSYLDYDALMRKGEILLGGDIKLLTDMLGNLILKDGILDAECVDHRWLIGRKKIVEAERYLYRIFGQGALPNPHAAAFTDARRGLTGFAPELNERQLQAVRNAMDYRISLIVGEAGTGKTYMERKLVESAKHSGKGVTLTAPTGKAAKRMEEMVGEPALTMHQLLGYNGRRYNDSLLNTDMIILDESSMIASDLGGQFFHSVDFRRTSVVMVGDHHQLPPIGPGNLLRDLVNARSIPITMLEQVMRQSGPLKDKCVKLLHGEVDRGEIAGVWHVIDQFQDAERIKQIIMEVLLEKIDNMGFDLIREVQIICPRREGPLGANTLNRLEQKVIQKKLYNVDVPDGPIVFLLHDKVIQTRNNYELGVMNGTIGYVTKVAGDGTLEINFEGVGTVALRSGTEEMNDIELAYALTIHKAQGSEFPCVIPIIHQSHSYAHDRNLLYMSVTRARQLAAIVGDPWAISHCAERNRIDQRKTLLSHWLSPGTVAVPA